MRKTFKYRLYPTKQQQRLLDEQLEERRWLYNHLLAERKQAWEERQEVVRLYEQQATLPALKAERPRWQVFTRRCCRTSPCGWILPFKPSFDG
jgi:putative transposase